MSTPPDIYIVPVSNSITTMKDFLLEYRKSIMKISEWQNWYDVQVGSNYYHYSTNEINDFYSNNQLE